MSKEKDNSIELSTEETYKKIVREELTNLINHSGIGNKNQLEILTNFNQTDGELLLRGKTNSFIVIGRDRIAGPLSGKGGSGHNQAASIDLVAGHGGTRPVNAVNGAKILSDKNFANDAARIYISQLCDLDKYLGIPKQFVNFTPASKAQIQINDGRSGVGIKADTVCLVGRENIKICTSHKETNSQGNSVGEGGVDIIAGIDNLNKALIPQPMVKGNNLKQLLEKILIGLQDLQTSVTNLADEQSKFNSILENHSHQIISAAVTGPPISNGQLTTINKSIINQSKYHFANMIDFEQTKFEFLVDGNEKSILSRYNRVN